IGRQRERLLRGLLFVVVCVVDDDVACGGVERKIERLRKHAALLRQPITDGMKLAALREHREFGLDRSVAKTKREMVRDAIAVRDLVEIAVCDDRAVQRAHGEESVNESFAEAD